MFHELWAGLGGVVFVIGNQFSMLYPVHVQKLPGDARIFASDHVGAGEDVERAERDVGGVADRRGDDVKTMREPLLRFTRFWQAATVINAQPGID